MAKLHQLKEIINYEMRNPSAKVVRQRRNVVEARTSEFSSVRQLLDELKVWKTALQIGMSVPVHPNQK
jgi:hypothetical protein